MADRFAVEVAETTVSMFLAVLRKEGLAVGGNGGNGSEPPKNGRTAPRLVVRVDEAAVMLSRTPKAIRRLIDKGELKAVRHGRSVRIAVADILAFIEADRL